MVEQSSIDDPFLALSKSEQEKIYETAKIGYITRDVEYGGHRFGLRTLYIEEELAVGIVIKPYAGTLREPQAFATAIIACALTHVNGDENFCPPIGYDSVANARGRFNWIANRRFHFSLIEKLYSEYALMLNEQVSLLKSAENLLPIDPQPSSDLEDFFKAVVPLNEGHPEE